jgi:membrane associated rhomboid family serine protease
VILAFTAALQVPEVGDGRIAHLVILIVFAALTPVVLWLSSQRAGVAAPWLQYVVRTNAFVLYALGGDAVLMSWPGKLGWIPHVGALVVAVLAALVLSPPGAQRPPHREAGG